MTSEEGPPPSQGQLDTPVSGRALAKCNALDLVGNVDEVSNAWKNVKRITDGGEGVDLHDLLSYSSRDTQYSFAVPRGRPLLLHTWLQPCMSCASPRQCDPHINFQLYPMLPLSSQPKVFH